MNNERAFPWCGDLNETPTINLGMTLRDYFAAKAMQAFCREPASFGETWEDYVSATVQSAYEVADAMLEARK